MATPAGRSRSLSPMITLSPAPPTLPPGRRVYAVGDIHGCADRLAALHEAIAEDLARRPIPAPLVLHIGDYVDRGPDSAGVIATLLAGPALPSGVEVVNLMGNHERTMLEAIPEAHRAFLRALRLYHAEGGYLFVHAGIRPGVALEDQTREDLLRFRQPFLYTEQGLGAVVVHGHTPVKAPIVRANRIAIDTGAVFGGPLTAVVLEGGQVGFIA